MQKEYIIDGEFDFDSLHSQLLALEIIGYSGIAVMGKKVTVFFEESKLKLSAIEQKKLDKLLTNYIYVPSLSRIRELRQPFLLEVDWRINKAEDLGEDTTELRKYRQTLRDVTLQDLSALEWPKKPWES